MTRFSGDGLADLYGGVQVDKSPLAIVAAQEVEQLDIAVDDTLGMEVLDRLGDLVRDALDHAQIQSLAQSDSAEIAITALHHEDVRMEWLEVVFISAIGILRVDGLTSLIVVEDTEDVDDVCRIEFVCSRPNLTLELLTLLHRLEHDTLASRVAHVDCAKQVARRARMHALLELELAEKHADRVEEFADLGLTRTDADLTSYSRVPVGSRVRVRAAFRDQTFTREHVAVLCRLLQQEIGQRLFVACGVSEERRDLMIVTNRPI